MAITGFGVTELNLIGSSGTPKIESPNNINLSAVTVAISTNVTVGGALDVDGYTELDGVNVVGVCTATTFVGNISGAGVTASSVNAATESGDANCFPLFIKELGGEESPKVSNKLYYDSIIGQLTATRLVANADGLVVTGGGATITGVCTATSFVGPLTGNLAGTVNTAAQPNITSLGTLTGLDVNGHSELDNVNVSGVSTFAGNVGLSTDLNVVGIATAASFSGSGASLTGLTGAGASTYGSSTVSPVITVDGNGRITGITTANVSVGSSFAYAGARVFFSTGTPSGASTWYSVSSGNITTVSLDTNSFYNGSNGRYEIPAGVTKVRLRANIYSDSGSGNIGNVWSPYKNGSSISVSNGGFYFEGTESGSGYGAVGSSGVSGVISVSEGDYIQLAYQVSGTGRSYAGTWQLEVVEGSLLGHYFASTNVTNADNVTVQANNSTDETVYPIFVDGATGSQGPESDTGFTYNPSSGELSATTFKSSDTTGDGSDVAFATKYYITANGSSAYRFAGAGVLNSTDDPTLYFQRGSTYILENSTGGSHPFALRVSDGGSAYAPGGQFLTGSTTGTQVLTVPMDAPVSIVYQCTAHAGMVGIISFR